MPFAELNALYTYILSTVEDTEKLLRLLGVLFIFKTIDSGMLQLDLVHMIDAFMCWPIGETQLVLGQLTSLINCDDEGYISVKHTSLSDFLLDPSRSQQFYLYSDQLLSEYACLCLHHMAHHLNDDSIDEALDLYDSVRKCLRSGAIVTQELQNAFKTISLKQLHALELRGNNLSEPFVSFYSTMLITLHERGLEELYAHHFSAYHDLVVPLLQKYPSDGNLLFPLYIVAHEINHVDCGSFIEDPEGTAVGEFDRRHGLNLVWDMWMSGDHTFRLADSPVRCALTNDITLQSITFCGQSHATLSLHCLHTLVSMRSRKHYPPPKCFALIRIMPRSIVYASRSNDLIALIQEWSPKFMDLKDGKRGSWDNEGPLSWCKLGLGREEISHENLTDFIKAMNVYFIRYVFDED